jgi:CheY-like chemotaxis protein
MFDGLRSEAHAAGGSKELCSVARRVLFIEDNRDLAESARMMLEPNGHSVHLAHSGQEGIEVARTIIPNVIFCDLGLPGMNRYGFCEALCQEAALAGALEIALSGHGSNGTRSARQRPGSALFCGNHSTPCKFPRWSLNRMWVSS